MIKKYFLPFVILIACGTNSPKTDDKNTIQSGVSTTTLVQHKNTYIEPEGSTLETRIIPPKGYQRISTATSTFATYLRSLKLKPHNSPVLYHDGMPKNKKGVYIAVVDMEIGKRDLQQCADAVMRLRGEYLFKQNRLDDIHFNFLSDGKPRYFKTYANGDHSYTKFRKYMDYVFAYANTSSLHQELAAVNDFKSMQIGDVLIQKGRPYGHAVTIMDMAINTETGEKVYLLGQSYMPAQETQILLNPENPSLGPWYKLKEGTIHTPEWTFEPKDLRRFRD